MKHLTLAFVLTSALFVGSWWGSLLAGWLTDAAAGSPVGYSMQEPPSKSTEPGG